MAKKPLTIKQKIRKYRAIQWSTFFSQYICIASPYVVLGVINWDFTINEAGEPLLIEANTRYGSIWLSQMAHGVGAFGAQTDEVLSWLKTMKRLSSSERREHLFGN